jgi:hypothetical protein
VGYVADHLNEFNTVTNQLSSVKVDFDDEVRALLILQIRRGLPSKDHW